MQDNLAIDILGWAGVATVLVAYWLVSTQRVHGAAISYQLLNLLGSAGLLTNSFYYGAIPSVSVNAIWIIIAGYALVRARLEGTQPV